MSWKFNIAESLQLTFNVQGFVVCSWACDMASMLPTPSVKKPSFRLSLNAILWWYNTHPTRGPFFFRWRCLTSFLIAQNVIEVPKHLLFETLLTFLCFRCNSAFLSGGLASIWNSFISPTLWGLAIVVVAISTDGNDGKRVKHVFTLGLTVAGRQRTRVSSSG